MKACRDCVSWEISSADVRFGECRTRRPDAFVRPPQRPGDSMAFGRLFPVTSGTDWCGEFLREPLDDYLNLLRKCRPTEPQDTSPPVTPCEPSPGVVE